MEYDLVNDQYYAMVSIPESAVDFYYKISAFDIYENSAETSVQELSVEENEIDGGDDETDDEETDDDVEEQDSDDDGLSDDIEESLGSDSKNNSDVISVEELEGYLVDIDGDGSSDRFYVPSDETSTTVTKDDDGNYDIDVDGDGVMDYTYNVTTKSLEEYGGTDEPDSTPGFSFGLIIVSLTLILLMLFHKKIF
jgi:hypothetical protein